MKLLALFCLLIFSALPAFAINVGSYDCTPLGEQRRVSLEIQDEQTLHFQDDRDSSASTGRLSKGSPDNEYGPFGSNVFELTELYSDENEFSALKVFGAPVGAEVIQIGVGRASQFSGEMRKNFEALSCRLLP